MIKITVSEAYAYDYHAIALLKATHDGGGDNMKNLGVIHKDLEEQIGPEKHEEILGSSQYAEMCRVNGKLFDLINFSKSNPVNAQAIDQLNYERWQAKQALQKAFFPEQPFNEQKIGYSNGG